MRILKNKVVLKKILFTMFIFFVYRFGCALTVPGVDSDVIELGIYSPFALMNLMGGGSLKNFSIFALGVSPYITAGIIIQMLAGAEVIPILFDWSKEGEKGKKKLERVTRVLALVLAVVQGASLVYGFNTTYGIMESTTFANFVFVTLMLVAGTMIVTWLGDCIELYGVGNGISMIIFAGIVSSIPTTIYQNFGNLVLAAEGTSQVTQGILHFLAFLAIYIVLIVGVIIVEGAERRVPIQNSKGFQNGSNNSFLPVKLNPAGVMPVIFAQTLITTPQMLMSFISYSTYESMSEFLSFNKWSGIAVYAILIFLFSFIYTDIVFDAESISEEFKKNGSYIPTVRPGKDTEKYIKYVLKKTIIIGAVGITVIATLPYLLGMFATTMNTDALGGNGIIICVGVALEVLALLDQVQTDNKYKSLGFGFSNKSDKKSTKKIEDKYALNNGARL